MMRPLLALALLLGSLTSLLAQEGRLQEIREEIAPPKPSKPPGPPDKSSAAVTDGSIHKGDDDDWLDCNIFDLVSGLIHGDYPRAYFHLSLLLPL